jgi:hypothetical protein
MWRSNSSFFFVAALLLFATQELGAAQVESGEVPVDLVMALVGGEAQDSRLFLGRVPPEVEGKIPLGDAERVVGGLAQSRGGTIVIQVGGDPSASLDTYAEHLEQQGWVTPAVSAQTRGGFQQTSQFNLNIWCGEGYSVRVSGFALNAANYLRVQYTNRGLMPTVCDAQEARFRQRMDPYREVSFPTLEAPPAAVVRSGGGGGSSDGISLLATVETQLPAEVIFEHYAQQLTAAGWVPEGRSVAEEVSIGRWLVESADGLPLVGTLAVLKLAADGSYRMWARLDGADRRR